MTVQYLDNGRMGRKESVNKLYSIRKRAGSSFGKFASYKEKLEKLTEFTTFRVNKMLPISLNTFKTL
jgi:hypothetical protein